MSFEVRDHDLAGRVGKLKTRSGVIETPALLPVINPNVQPITPKEMKEEFKVSAIITNAYILMKSFRSTVIEKGVHEFLGFDGVVATDSGAYQLLLYGNVDATPHEIVEFQEQIGPDIATILDVPTGWGVGRKDAEKTVESTISRAEELFRYRTREDLMWIGPIQGGLYLDLVERSAKKMADLPFDIYALGSPTPIMERYLFTDLVNMITSARNQIPESKPFHLFGAGHPFMLALAVALGCDLFDSAAYAIFAREDRYMTDWGTNKLSDLGWLSCSCPVCVRSDPKDLLDLPKDERFKALARHNLYRCVAEVQRIKQSIYEGRLWEHLEVRARSHPSLLSALKTLKNYVEYLEKRSPTMKRKGMFFFDSSSLVRPEIYRHTKRLFRRLHTHKEKKVLFLIPKHSSKQLSSSSEYRNLKRVSSEILGGEAETIHVCLYGAPFGIIPIELEGTYPLTQYVTAEPLDMETVNFAVKIIEKYILGSEYRIAILVCEDDEFGDRVCEAFEKVCNSKGVIHEKLKTLDFSRREFLEGVIRMVNEKLKKNDAKISSEV